MFRVAYRSLLARKWRLLSTSIAVILGVAFIVGTSVLGSTLTQSVSGLINSTYSNIDVVIRNSGEEEIRPPLPETLISAIEGVAGIDVVSASVSSPVQVANSDGTAVTSVTALPTLITALSSDPRLRPRQLAAGRWPRSADEATLDRSLANAGDFSIGDTVTVAAQSSTAELRIVGVTSLDGSDSGATEQFVTVIRPTAQRLSGIEAMVDRIDVIAQSTVRPDDLAKRIRDELGPDYEIITGTKFSEEQQGEAAGFVEIITQAVGVFGWVALFVAIFVIHNTFATLIAQRSRELALLRAIGASRKQIVGAVLIEATVVGVVAGLAGVFIGYALALVPIRLIDGVIPVGTLPGLELRAVLVGVGLAILTTILSALWPAINAGRVAPVAAMNASTVDQHRFSIWRILVSAAVAAASISALVFTATTTSKANNMVWAGVGAAGLILSIVAIAPTVVRTYAQLLVQVVRRLSPVTGRIGVLNAARTPTRTATTASALFVGVTIVAATSLLANSMRSTFAETFDNRLIGDLIIDSGVPGLGGLSPAVEPRIAGVDGVAASSPVRFAPSKVRSDRSSASDKEDNSRAITLGVNMEDIFDLIDLGTIEGDPNDMGDDGIVVPRAFAEPRGLKIGKTLTVELIGTGPVDFTVKVITEKPIFFDRSFLIDTEAFQKHVVPVLQFDAYVYTKVEQGRDLDMMRSAISTAIADQPTAKVLTPTEFAGIRVQRLDAALTLIYALLGLAIIVAIVGIWNTLQLSIVERRIELGLTRAVGASRRQMRRMIGWEAMAISILGTLSGVATGVFIGRSIVASLPGIELSATLSGRALLVISVGGLLSGLLAAAIPARRAARAPILEQLS